MAPYGIGQAIIFSSCGQLPPPIILLGDFNAHSTKWGSSKNDSKGKMISDLMVQHNLSLLNDGSATYLHSGSGSQSAIYLSICDPSLYLDFSWKVHDDLCGSDHFPIIIHSDRALPAVTNSTWKLSKADWDTLSDKAAFDLKADCIINAADPVGNFTDTLCTPANSTIPESKSKPVKLNTIWFNDQCKEVIKTHNKRTEKNSIPTQLLLTLKIQNYSGRAKDRRTIKTRKTKFWHRYVSSINNKHL